MKPERPAANDVPPEFLAKRPFAEKPSPEFLKMARDIIDRDLEVMYYRVKDDFFDGMKEIALEGTEEKVRKRIKRCAGSFTTNQRRWPSGKSSCRDMSSWRRRLNNNEDQNNPAGGDQPRRFYDEQPFKVEVSDQLLKTNQDLAQHDVEVARHKLDGMLQQLADYIFETSMENAKKSPKQAREADDLIRKLFDVFPEAIAQWDAFIQTCEIADEEIEDV